MDSIEIYTTPWCPYCARARQLLDSKGLRYQEIGIENDRGLAQAMMDRAGRTSVPQIFIGGEHVGGSDDLQAAERSGELQQLLTKHSISA